MEDSPIIVRVDNPVQPAPYQLFDPLSPEDYAALRDDIARRGVLVPVELDEHGHILDGHHRVQIAEELGIDFPRIIRPGLSEAEKREHVRSLNLFRRHLTREQRRSIIADQLRETPEQSNRQVAATLGVDHHTVSTVRDNLAQTGEIPQLERTRGADGKTRPTYRPAIVAKTQLEERQVTSALSHVPADVLPGKLVDAKRATRIVREYTARRRAAALAAPIQPGGADVRHGDFRDVLQDVADSSAALILTDPPYLKQSLPLWGDLGRFAARVLRPGGLLVACSGQFYLPEVLGALAEHLHYVWMGALLFPGEHAEIQGRHLHNGWNPVVIFARPPYLPGRWWADVLTSETKTKDLHVWQKAEGPMRQLVEAFSDAGDLVVDPFLGSGTTAAVALTLGRRVIGAELDPVAYATVCEQLSGLEASA